MEDSPWLSFGIKGPLVKTKKLKIGILKHCFPSINEHKSLLSALLGTHKQVSLLKLKCIAPFIQLVHSSEKEKKKYVLVGAGQEF